MALYLQVTTGSRDSTMVVLDIKGKTLAVVVGYQAIERFARLVTPIGPSG